jgi:serine/threonine-protein kinase
VKVLLEYISGSTIDRLNSPGVGTLLRVFEQAADAVAHLHENGLLHADLKPNNIMLGPAAVKLIDFGLSREIGEDTGRLQGTPEYMPPETAARKTVDVRTDIYSFGATMYRMFTGQYPPKSVGGFPMTERSWGDHYRPAADVNHALPHDVTQLIDQCLRFNPLDRPHSMDEVCRELNRIVDSISTG